MYAKNSENRLAVDHVMAKIIGLTFLAHPVENWYLFEANETFALHQLEMLAF